MWRPIVGVAGAALMLASTVSAVELSPVRIYVTSIGAFQGRTDPSKGRSDTVKDLQRRIADRKSLALATRREDATVVLIVMGRKRAHLGEGFFGDPARNQTVRVKLMADGIETNLTASAEGGTLGSSGSWGRAAAQIVDQVDKWVVANATRLHPEE